MEGVDLTLSIKPVLQTFFLAVVKVAPCSGRVLPGRQKRPG